MFVFCVLFGIMFLSIEDMAFLFFRIIRIPHRHFLSIHTKDFDFEKFFLGITVDILERIHMLNLSMAVFVTRSKYRLRIAAKDRRMKAS